MGYCHVLLTGFLAVPTYICIYSFKKLIMENFSIYQLRTNLVSSLFLPTPLPPYQLIIFFFLSGLSNRDFLSHSSGFQKTKISLGGFISRCRQDRIFSEGSSGEFGPSLVQLLQAAYIPWLTASSFIFKAGSVASSLLS